VQGPASVTDTTIATRVLKPGNGTVHPTPNSVVTVRFQAAPKDGADATPRAASPDAPIVWTLNRVLPALSEGVRLMVEGETRRIWIPPALSYPNRADRPSGVLAFDVELLAIAPPVDGPTAAEFAAPPADAKRTQAGVAYKVLQPGRGTERPKPLSTVTIAYREWLKGGAVIDDGVARGEPVSMAADATMPGLSDALMQMVEGEKGRFWIPPELTDTGLKSAPVMLVFDVELIEIQRAAAGSPGTIRVDSNSPDAKYVVVTPDGTPLTGKGPQTFAGAPPGRYRIKPEALRLYSTGVIASRADWMLPPGGTLDITIAYKPIVQ
jgi:FKBP-type peptidyl-prolyl cis-trans isomerase